MDSPYQVTQHSEATLENNLEIVKEEVRRGIKTRKAPGICGIGLDMLKVATGGEMLVDWVSKVFNVVWREGVNPSD